LAIIFFVFILVTVSLAMGKAVGEGKPTYFIIGAAVLVIASVIGTQLNWMRLDKYDSLPRAKYATIALCLAMTALSSALLAVVYEPDHPVYLIGGVAENVPSGGVDLLNAADQESYHVNPASCTPFFFPTKIQDGSQYNVQFKTPPSGGECSISGGVGTAKKDVTSIRITCTVLFSVGGRVSGLKGAPVVVALNGDRTGQSISQDGSFVFDNKLANGVPWSVSVVTSPSGLSCGFDPPTSGTITGADVTSLSLTCR